MSHKKLENDFLSNFFFTDDIELLIGLYKLVRLFSYAIIVVNYEGGKNRRYINKENK